MIYNVGDWVWVKMCRRESADDYLPGFYYNNSALVSVFKIIGRNETYDDCQYLIHNPVRKDIYYEIDFSKASHKEKDLTFTEKMCSSTLSCYIVGSADPEKAYVVQHYCAVCWKRNL